MNNIYLTCRMNLRQYPSLEAPVLKVLEKNQILPVIEIIPEKDGYIWFRTTQGYVANVDEVFYHANDYPDTTAIKQYINDWLDGSLVATCKSIEEVKKALESF